jgi:aspartate aminotransferase
MLTERIRAVPPSLTLRWTALARQLEAQGKRVINLAAGEPDFDTPAFIKSAAIRAIEEGRTKYTPTVGIPELRQAVAHLLTRYRQLDCTPDEIVITCGAKQALYNVLQVLVQEGDEVLIPSPYWVSYPEMVRLAGATPVKLQLDPKEGFRLRARDVEAACTSRTRCLILNSPSNPTGVVLGKEDLEEIARVVEDRNLWVISDEIYWRLCYGTEALSIAAVCPRIRTRTIVVDGVSKTYAMTGWRIGYLWAAKEIIEAVGRLQDHSTSNPCSISQWAALAALRADEMEETRQMVEEFARRRDILVDRLSRMNGIDFVRPQGAFYVFVDISATGLRSEPFTQRLLEEAGVAVVPGAGFGWDTHVRLSFALGRKALEEGLDRFERFLKGL